METADRSESNSARRTVQFRRDWSTTAPSHAVLEALAIVEDTTLLALRDELGTALYDYVDPEALDAIIGSGRSTPIELSFEVQHLRVTIATDGRLVVSTTRE
ncbi:HalOD1 output domain-containing protein [Halosolutus gelatinilyticus]|uniref:HalOD1 output domain-containing protein n=1 Tax=Halosolutus gelatinilyticus TaxID=2931975 RepID=UPI001FF14228|nr:HalOD1 output domain-containing protein [Halosolutus gelatinilyticus]